MIPTSGISSQAIPGPLEKPKLNKVRKVVKCHRIWTKNCMHMMKFRKDSESEVGMARFRPKRAHSELLFPGPSGARPDPPGPDRARPGPPGPAQTHRGPPGSARARPDPPRGPGVPGPE